MDKYIFLVLVLLNLAIPAFAVDLDGGNVNVGATEDTGSAAATSEVAAETTVPDQELEEDAAVLAVSDPFTGGYWFVCDCALGSDLKFYVPADWAFDMFALDNSGAPVNMSNTTVYAYCDQFPDYTFSCSRFGKFTYRTSNNYNSADLNITEISDTNIDFLENNGLRLSDYDLRIMVCSLIIVVAAILIFKKG